jgi:glycosyltransferase involved in cell wall biosynthesis
MSTSSSPTLTRRRGPRANLHPAVARTRDVEIVVPVYNEAATLERSILQLHGFLTSGFPFSWRIVIADNASSDGTLRLAHRLERELRDVEVLHLPAKGRGRALRAAWSASDARVLCYMDVDLSTDLSALLPLIAPLYSGHSDLAIGTRLHRGSRVVRGRKREFISRSYNRLLRLVLRSRFSDAQCGFKAIRADVARTLLPAVRDEEWFFDTELLVLAQRWGLRTHEVPVDWIEDTDSRVQILHTALADLHGVGRLLGASPVARFTAVGVLSTLAYAVLYLVLRAPLGSVLANAPAVTRFVALRTWVFATASRPARLTARFGQII